MGNVGVSAGRTYQRKEQVQNTWDNSELLSSHCSTNKARAVKMLTEKETGKDHLKMEPGARSHGSCKTMFVSMKKVHWNCLM